MDNEIDTTLRIEAVTDPRSMTTGMQFCASRYQAIYRSHWRAFPDILFVAHQSGQVVSTLGMELGINHSHFGAERYFHLGPRMQGFLQEHRGHTAELGRFASRYQDGARRVFRAAIDYAIGHDITYFVAWANPSVIAHLRHTLGIPFWDLPVQINRQAIENDTAWVAPPHGFFFRPDPPRLLLSITSFWEYVPYSIPSKEDLCRGQANR